MGVLNGNHIAHPKITAMARFKIFKVPVIFINILIFSKHRVCESKDGSHFLMIESPLKRRTANRELMIAPELFTVWRAIIPNDAKNTERELGVEWRWPSKKPCIF